MIYLIAGIFIIQLVNVFSNLANSLKVNHMNQEVQERHEKAFEFEKQRTEQWKSIMETEIAELKELAAGSKYLEKLVSDLEKQNTMVSK